MRDDISESPEFLLALLNAKLLNFAFAAISPKLQGRFFRYKKQYLEPLPIRRIAFATPPEEREELVEEALMRYEAYLEHGEDVSVWAFVTTRLLAEEPEQADVVHDFLAYLAKQMIEMNQQKQSEIKGFLSWVEREIRAKVDDLSNTRPKSETTSATIRRTNLNCPLRSCWRFSRRTGDGLGWIPPRARFRSGSRKSMRRA